MKFFDSGSISTTICVLFAFGLIFLATQYNWITAIILVFASILPVIIYDAYKHFKRKPNAKI